MVLDSPGREAWVLIIGFKKKLNRVFISQTWLQLFPQAWVSNILSGRLDHSVLKVSLEDHSPVFANVFKFENA